MIPPRLLAVVGLVLLWSSSALAQTTTTHTGDSPYEVFDLARGHLPLPDGHAWPQGEQTCQLEALPCAVLIQGRSLKRVEGKCPALWNQPQPGAMTLTCGQAPQALSARLVHRAPTQPTAAFPIWMVEDEDGEDDPMVSFSKVLPDGGRLAIRGASGWVEVELDDEGMADFEGVIIEALGTPMPAAYTDRVDETRGYFSWGLRLTDPPPPEPSDEPPPPDPTKGFCKDNRKKYEDFYVICVDAEETPLKVELPDAGLILKPNTTIIVAARMREGYRLELNTEGERGLYTPGNKPLEDLFGDKMKEEDLKMPRAARAPPPPSFTVQTRMLAPRLPGQVDIEVVVFSGGTSVYGRHHIELTVERTYASALRLGIAGIFLGAVDRSYEPRTQPGAGQAEIAAAQTGDYDLEIVVGYAAFFDEGGRGYSQPSSMRFAPYLGVGLLSQSGDEEIDFLKSVHLGVEWELNASFSVALTGVLRRVDRLAPGARVGSPVGDTVPTISTQSLGMGLILNFSPDFLRFGVNQATGGALQ